MDWTATCVSLTLWGNMAQNFDGVGNPIVGAKNAKVSDYNGVTLSGREILILVRAWRRLITCTRSRLTGSPRSWGPTPGVSTAAWAVTWGLRSIGHSQLHTGPLPLPKPAMSSISVFVHMSGGERAHLQPQCGGGEAHHQPEEIRPVLAVRVSQWDP